MTIEKARPESTVIENNISFSQNDAYIENISNALVSFLSLSKQVRRSNLCSSSLDLGVSQKIKPQIEISVEEEKQSETWKEGENKIEIRLKTLRDYIIDTAPDNWTLALKQEELKSWISLLKKDLNLELDFDIEIVYDQEKTSAYLNINNSKIKLYEFRDWVSLLNDYRKDLTWEEIENQKLVKIKGLDDIKYVEALLINTIKKNPKSQLYEFLWLAYKTSEEFIMFRNKENDKNHAFLKQGDFYTSISF